MRTNARAFEHAMRRHTSTNAQAHTCTTSTRNAGMKSDSSLNKSLNPYVRTHHTQLHTGVHAKRTCLGTHAHIFWPQTTMHKHKCTRADAGGCVHAMNAGTRAEARQETHMHDLHTSRNRQDQLHFHTRTRACPRTSYACGHAPVWPTPRKRACTTAHTC